MNAPKNSSQQVDTRSNLQRNDVLLSSYMLLSEVLPIIWACNPKSYGKMLQIMESYCMEVYQATVVADTESILEEKERNLIISFVRHGMITYKKHHHKMDSYRKSLDEKVVKQYRDMFLQDYAL